MENNVDTDTTEIPATPPATVRLGDEDVRLAPPRSQGVLYELWSAAGTNAPRAFSACLGQCWQGKTKPKATYNGDVLAYGLAVADELADRGLTMDDIQTAGALAYSHVGRALKRTSAAEVRDRQGF